MEVIRHQQDEIRSRSSSQSEGDFSFWVSRNTAFLALQGASWLLFLFIFLSLRMDFFSLLSFNLGRTHMFILCNGIVAILVKGSVLAEEESQSHEDDEAEKKEMKNVHGIQKTDEICVEEVVEIEKKNVGIEDKEEKNEELVVGCDLVAETEQIDLQLVEEEEREEEQEEEGFEELSVEELNKKCDEFIRRMRGVISNRNANGSL